MTIVYVIVDTVCHILNHGNNQNTHTHATKMGIHTFTYSIRNMIVHDLYNCTSSEFIFDCRSYCSKRVWCGGVSDIRLQVILWYFLQI